MRTGRSSRRPRQRTNKEKADEGSLRPALALSESNYHHFLACALAASAVTCVLRPASALVAPPAAAVASRRCHRLGGLPSLPRERRTGGTTSLLGMKPWNDGRNRGSAAAPPPWSAHRRRRRAPGQPRLSAEPEGTETVASLVDDDESTFGDFGVGEKTLSVKAMAEADDGAAVAAAAAAKTFDGGPSLNPRALLKFVAPTLALWVAPPVMSLIDSAVVGRHCGPVDLAALSPGCTLIDSSAYLFMFIATATTNIVASSRAGKKDGGDGVDGDDDDHRAVAEALFLALCGGTFLTSIALFAGRPILSAIAGRRSATVVPSALRYSAVRSFGQPAVLLATVARAAALATKDTRGPLLSVAIAFVLNAVGTTALVRVFGMGITGAAVGTLVADVTAAAFLLARRARDLRAGRDAAKEGATTAGGVKTGGATTAADPPPPTPPLIAVPNGPRLRRFVRYAAPMFFTILGKSVVYNGVGIAVGRLGEVSLAAHQVLLRSFFFWTPVGDSIGMTSQVFLPSILADERNTGVAKPGAKRLLFGMGAVAGAISAMLAGALPSRFGGLFTADAAVAEAMRAGAPILASSVLFHAIALTCEGMLLAQEDLKFLSTSYVATTVATILFLLSPFRPATLEVSWLVLALFQGGRALQFSLRTVWLSRKSSPSPAVVSGLEHS